MITRLTLTNFRNHKTFRINASENVALVGSNGTGKTNVLEALSLLNGTMGFRHAESSEIARFGTDNYAVQAETKDGMEISVYWQAAGSRKAKINGDRIPLGELSKMIGIIWLTPTQDQLFNGKPSDRRNFFDNLVGGFDGNYIGRIVRLHKLLTERAVALKNDRDDTWLDLIDKNIVEVSSGIADARVRYVSELNHFFDFGEIGLSGILEQKIINGEKNGDFEDFYMKYLVENRFLISDKMTIKGSHHTDFLVKNKDLDLPADKTSSGQQKLLLNRLIIANAKLIAAKNPDKSLLILLDEAASHLDSNARNELFYELGQSKAQIWTSGTELSESIYNFERVNL